MQNKKNNKFSIWLKKPFPFYENYKQKLLEPILISGFILFFLIVFNPANNSDFLFIQFWKIFVYCAITFFVIAIFNFIIPIIFKKLFDIENWNIQKTIFFILSKFIFVGLLNGIFAYNFDNSNSSQQIIPFLIDVFLRTVSIGIIPTIIFVFYLEKSLYKKHHNIALKTIENIKNNKQFASQSPHIKTIAFPPTIKDKIIININDLFCIKAEGNYCIIYFNKNNKLEKTMQRCTLKEIEQENSKNSNLLRCHKSFIINLEKVSDLSGNARGYFFCIDKLNFKIPGSRNLSKSFISNFKEQI